MSDSHLPATNSDHTPWARIGFLSALIVFTVAMRVAPHPWNFVPVGAVALFGGATFRSRWLAFLIPLAAMFIADVCLALMHGYDVFTPTMALVYGCYACYVMLGFGLRSRRKPLPIAGAALTGGIVFYLVTNLAAWWALSTGTGALYTRDLSGVMNSYIQALPYFGNHLLGDAVFCAMLFGALAFAESKYPALQAEPQMQPTIV